MAQIIIEKAERLELIQAQILRFTQMDFSMRIPLSEKGDDIDAIIVGLNTLGEELSTKELLKN
ncbi:MAG TPA: hypothetical protein VN026_03880 [Bacteroidia bacterium]|jgi:hypothetical protein|nr:hypothetical protein [Bacteroidia bacterium]